MGRFLDEVVDVLAMMKAWAKKSKDELPAGASSLAKGEGCPLKSATQESIEHGIRNGAETSEACQTFSLASKSRRPQKRFRETYRNDDDI
jgi:hypothetical protein